MNDHLGVGEALELLPHLKQAIRQCATSEEKLDAQFQAQSAAAKKELDTAVWQLAGELNESLAKAEADFQRRQAQCQAKFERRQNRIRQAHRTSRKQALNRIEDWEGRRKYQLQRSVLDTDKGLETASAQAAARCEDFKQKLAATGEAFADLETAARKAFRGYRSFRRWLSASWDWPIEQKSPDEYKLQEELETLHRKTRDELQRFQRRLLPRWFGHLSIWLMAALLLLGAAGLVPWLRRHGLEPEAYRDAGICLAAMWALLWAVYSCGRHRAAPEARSIAASLAQAHSHLESCLKLADQRLQREQERLKREFDATKASLNEQWQETVRAAAEQRALRPQQIDDKLHRVSERNEQMRRATLERLERNHRELATGLRQSAEARQPQLAAAHETRLAKLKADEQVQRRVLSEEGKSRIRSLYQAIEQANAAAAQVFPPWEDPGWEGWVPPREFTNAVKFGRLEVDVEPWAGLTAANGSPDLPCPLRFSAPLLLTYPRQGSVLFETTSAGLEEVVPALNNIVFRLLSTTPAAKLSFTLMDPIGLGQSFAGLMHLADYAEGYINGRIWTQPQQIEEKLAELNEHIEKVIQMYLRNEYATIAEYNARAGAIAEKYHLLVVAGFPVNFSETAGRRLLHLATSGARCGVFTLIHWDQRHALPPDFVPDDLRKNSVCVLGTANGCELAGLPGPGIHLILDAPPRPETATRFLRKVGEASQTANRVEVPFVEVAPAETQIWTGDTTEELRVAIGRSGATKLQLLAIGQGTRQHALIAGKTGSGKSNLFHAIITNLALWCSPDQVEFYLVDFKKGVEFKCYGAHRLPHARVVAIESDREFGLSVLQRVDEELRRRGELFRQLGVQDLPGYKMAGGAEAMPRCLLIIDEFQEFFVEEDRISQSAAVLLDRAVRQGRAFGIHVLLGSQTLGGAYTLARATLGQMVIRIALQCNEADAYLIMDEGNAAPRLLSRPGEGIYNDAAGALEGNSPFQAVWLPEREREAMLAKIRARADRSGRAYAGPMVFEGNAPADVRENALLMAVLATTPVNPPPAARVWLGSPNSIKGPTEAAFQRRSGHHLLIVGQREEAALAMLSIALVSLAAQYPPGTAQFIFLDSSPPGSRPHEFLDAVMRVMPCPVTRPTAGELTETLNHLADGLMQHSGQPEAEGIPATFLLINGLENFRKLRQEEEFSFSMSAGDTSAAPAARFLDLINEGPSHGLHVIAGCDTYNNVTRILGRKALSEIAMRVLFQMSASDSANLLEGPDASNLGLHRALFYHEQEGYLETFRPYALPSQEWIELVGERLARRSISASRFP